MNTKSNQIRSIICSTYDLHLVIGTIMPSVNLSVIKVQILDLSKSLLKGIV